MRTELKISLIHLQISANVLILQISLTELDISEIELQISVIQLKISCGRGGHTALVSPAAWHAARLDSHWMMPLCIGLRLRMLEEWSC